MKSLSAFVLACCLYAPLAWSQCAPGVPSAGNPGCIPQDRAESPYFHGDPEKLNAARPQERWEDRWGAIAIDSKTGQAGLIAGKASKAEAVDVAMSGCEMHGSPGCKLRLAYFNQCVAIGWGATWNEVVTAETEQRAGELALKGCSKKTTECKIAYSACSQPKRVE
jgi:hypothetical protein